VQFTQSSGNIVPLNPEAAGLLDASQAEQTPPSQSELAIAPANGSGTSPLEQLVLRFPDTLEGEADQEAEWFGWDFHLAQAELSLMLKLVNGDWNHLEFLVVPPGWKVVGTPGEMLTAEAAVG
jgi:hypothetical protein